MPISTRAAQLCGTLQGLLESVEDSDSPVFPVPAGSASLTVVVDAYERVAARGQSSSAAFHLLSLQLLAHVISAANFLEADNILKHACTVAAHRLAGHNPLYKTPTVVPASFR